jgi:hypothetical protein
VAGSGRSVTRAQGFWDTASGVPTTAPGNGKYRADNWAAPTAVAIAAQDADGYNRHDGLILLVAGDVITQQATNNSQNYQRWSLTAAPVDNATWLSFAVTVTETGSAFAAPGSNQRRLLDAMSLTAPPAPETLPNWQLWAPPLDPPVAGGLPVSVAQSIADATWATDPHMCAALQWEAYAGMLPPMPAVSSVSTGAQSVAYSPPLAGGDFGLAMQRAEYHRKLAGSLTTAQQLTVADPAKTSVPGNPWIDTSDYSQWWTVA